MIKTLSFMVTGVLIGSCCPGNASEEEKPLSPNVPSSSVPKKEIIKDNVIAQKKLHSKENIQRDVLPTKIQLQNKRILQVRLSQELKSKLVEEELEAKKLPEASGEITKAFNEQFKKAQSRQISDRVMGFYFKIDTYGKVRGQTFLGENAE